LLVDLLGCEAHYLMATDDAGEMVGALPLMAATGAYGKIYNSLPFFGSYGGIVAATPDAAFALHQEYRRRLAEPDVAAGTVIVNPLTEQAQDYPFDFLDSRIGQITSLDFGPDPHVGLRGLIDATARRNIKTARRAGIIVGEDPTALPILAEIHNENIAAIGGRTKSMSFFSLINEKFSCPDDYRVYVARLDGEVIGGLLLFYAGQVVDYYTPGTRLEHRALQPSALLLETAMTDAAKEGYRLWNWGGTWHTQEGVLRFKRKWGATDIVYRYYTSVRNKALLNADPDRLVAEYGFFYVLPFAQLNPAQGGK
jgi:hypothetical protein